jgi:hypothetical protein
MSCRVRGGDMIANVLALVSQHLIADFKETSK